MSDRACIYQLKAEKNKLSVWMPGPEGLWEWRRVLTGGIGAFLDDPKLLLVRGASGDQLCLPVVEDPLTGLRPTDIQRAVRTLDAGYWTFLRPLKDDDPAIPGA